MTAVTAGDVAASAAAAAEELLRDAHLPKSGSSAMPDPSAESVPRLKARIHNRLTAEECAKIPLSALRFRPLHHGDFEELVQLHTEWFPVSYDDAFYQSCVRGDIFSMVATCRSGGSSSSQPGQCQRNGAPTSGDVGMSDGDEDLLGIITMSMSCEHHCSDIVSVLGADCATCCRRGGAASTCGASLEEGLGAEEDTSQSGSLAYILTLGVVDEFRRRGLGRELLRQLIQHVDENMPHVLAIYLHVVTYNGAAIALYESTRFQRIAHFPSFYYLHGKFYDSFLYALYLHQGRPPWKWRLRQFLGIEGNFTWREWLLSAVSIFWRSQASVEAPLTPKTPVRQELP